MQRFIMKEWGDWVNENLQLGNSKQSIFKQLLDVGYDYYIIKDKLQIDHIVDDNNKNIALRVATKVNIKNIEIYEIPNFLTNDECEQIISIMNSLELKDSTTFGIGERNITSGRTSKTCVFNEGCSIIEDIENRICKTLGINNKLSEKIQAQKYEMGQEFKLHTDFFSSEMITSNNIPGQRTWTFMIYLNNVLEGGYTSFPYANFSSKPEVGKAIIWNNLRTNGENNMFTHHTGMPVINGQKYILTKWFMTAEAQSNIENNVCINDFLPIFHPIGFEKIKLLNDEFDNMIVLKNKLTKWIDYKTELTQCNSNGIICAVIYYEPCELTITDHRFRSHNLIMEKNDVLFYESLCNLKTNKDTAFKTVYFMTSCLYSL